VFYPQSLGRTQALKGGSPHRHFPLPTLTPPVGLDTVKQLLCGRQETLATGSFFMATMLGQGGRALPFVMMQSHPTVKGHVSHTHYKDKGLCLNKSRKNGRFGSLRVKSGECKVTLGHLLSHSCTHVLHIH
jgi:hypothetical protein